MIKLNQMNINLTSLIQEIILIVQKYAESVLNTLFNLSLITSWTGAVEIALDLF